MERETSASLVSKESHLPVHWALIVGINYYPNDRDLQGSVQDAHIIQQYLEQYLNPTNTRISKLTATAPANPGCTKPIEPTEAWPNRANIVFHLKEIIEKANSGDFVYFHFSGHGSRIPGSMQPGHDSVGDLALVLFEDDVHGSSYLRGRHLAAAFHKMVDKGLIITVTLDCCFSGSVARNIDGQDVAVRCVDYNAAIDAVSSQNQGDGDFGPASTGRHSEIENNWLIDPAGYTILSACGPYEKAFEVYVEGQGRRGAMAHFLVRSLSELRRRGIVISHQYLHEIIRIQFHSFWPQQTPMRFGNTDLSFFGCLISTPSGTNMASIYTTDDDRIYLGSGDVHGVCVGDEFSVWPLDTPGNSTISKSSEAKSKVRVVAVRPFDSDVEVIQSEIESETIQFIGECKARPVSSLSTRCIRVQVPESLASLTQWQEATSSLRFLHFTAPSTKGESFLYAITINERGEYELVDALLEPVCSLPTIPKDSSHPIKDLLEVLQHVAAFNYFKGIENRAPIPSFLKLFSITSSVAASPSGDFHVLERDIWDFTVENLSTHPLYMASFNFDPSWGITNVISSAGGDDYMVIPPKSGSTNGKQPVRLRMSIPESLKCLKKFEFEDTIKVFLMSRPTQFPSLVLSGFPHGTHRSAISDAAKISKFIEELASNHHDRGDELLDEWAVQNFTILTKRDRTIA